MSEFGGKPVEEPFLDENDHDVRFNLNSGKSEGTKNSLNIHRSSSCTVPPSNRRLKQQKQLSFSLLNGLAKAKRPKTLMKQNTGQYWTI